MGKWSNWTSIISRDMDLLRTCIQTYTYIYIYANIDVCTVYSIHHKITMGWGMMILFLPTEREHQLFDPILHLCLANSRYVAWAARECSLPAKISFFKESSPRTTLYDSPRFYGLIEYKPWVKRANLTRLFWDATYLVGQLLSSWSELAKWE